MKPQRTTFSLGARVLHWVNALLILILLFSGDAAEDGSGLGYQMHIVLGTALLVLTVAQIGWYLFGPKPEDLPGLSRLRKLAFHWNHYLILLTTLMVTASGAILVWSGGLLGELHEGSAAPLVFLLLMHLAGVLYYQLTKGNTLGRMAPMLFWRLNKEKKTKI